MHTTSDKMEEAIKNESDNGLRMLEDMGTVISENDRRQIEARRKQRIENQKYENRIELE